MTASLCFQDGVQNCIHRGVSRCFSFYVISAQKQFRPFASVRYLFLTPTNFVPVTRPTGTSTKKQPILIHDLGLLSFLRFRSSLSLDMKTLGESLHTFWIHFGSFFRIFLILLFGIGFLAAM